MNGRFRRMLEPGERIMLRSTDGGAAWYLAGLFLLLGVTGWMRAAWDFEVPGPRFWTATLFLLVYALLVLAVAWPWTRWKWVITDRRVLKRYGMFSSDIGEMRHETVEAVRLQGDKLLLHGRKYRWEFAISRNFCRADILYDLFGARFDDPGLTAKPLGEMLEPGEAVLCRGIPVLTEYWTWALLLSGPLALAVTLVWPESREFLYFDPGMVLGPYAALLGFIVAAWRRRGWRTVLTDRRLLVRRHKAPSRCDAIPLNAVTGADWDRKNWELVIVSPSRRDSVFCLPWTARRILNTLENNDRGEALA